jgi:hypothetical protein
VGTLPTDIICTLDASTSNNYVLFRNSSDFIAPLSGIAFQDNNIGGFVAFKHYTGAATLYGDYLHIAGYNGVHIYGGTADSINPGARQAIMSCCYNNNGSGGPANTVAVGIGTMNPQYTLDVVGTSRFTGQMSLTNTVSNSGGGTWIIGSAAWSGTSPASTNTNSTLGLMYQGGSGSQLFTFSSAPGQCSLQIDGSMFIGDGSMYNPYSLSGSSLGYLVVQNSASFGGTIKTSGTSTNYVVGTGSAVTTNSATPTTVASVTITTNGKPVFVICTGDLQPVNGTNDWCFLQCYRDGTGIGNIQVHHPGTAASTNKGFASHALDTPAAGTYTYTCKAWQGSGNIQFGENGVPYITAWELI